jgi:hypothetical protein
MILRLLKPQGIAGIAVAAALALLLLLQKGETRHWQKQSGQFEQLYAGEKAAFAATMQSYRAAADQARAEDAANLQRVAAEQHAVNERTSNDYQARIAAARAVAERLRDETASGPTNPRAGGAAAVPGHPATAEGIAQAANQDQLSESDALIATEQAIQLDELIKWIRRQAAIDTDGSDATIKR